MGKPFVSVIVPVYKTEKYLRQCVDSIIHQTYKNLEIILVDDGSPDGSPAICDEYAMIDDRVKVIHQKNAGQSVARNVALDLCCGDYISFVDSDDWLEIHAIECLINKAEENNFDVIIFNANTVQNDVKTERFFPYENGLIMTAAELVDLTLKDIIGGQPWFKLYRKELWSNIRFPEGRIYEDLAVSFLPFTAAKGNIGFISEPLYNYRLNPEGTSLGGSPLRSYHIFLAFLDHLEYARIHNHPAKECCLAKAAAHAIGAFNDYLFYQTQEGNDYLPHIQTWLAENKKQIMSCKELTGKTRMCLVLYYYFPFLYPSIYRLSPSYRNRVN